MHKTPVCHYAVSRQGSLASTASGADFGNQPMPEEEEDLLDSPEQQRVGLRADASPSRQPYRMLSTPEGTSPTGHRLRQRNVSWGPRDAELNSDVSVHDDDWLHLLVLKRCHDSALDHSRCMYVACCTDQSVVATSCIARGTQSPPQATHPQVPQTRPTC